jgi:hypothetical protein
MAGVGENIHAQSLAFREAFLARQDASALLTLLASATLVCADAAVERVRVEIDAGPIAVGEAALAGQLAYSVLAYLTLGADVVAAPAGVGVV